jgi:hypothetical protein
MSGSSSDEGLDSKPLLENYMRKLKRKKSWLQSDADASESEVECVNDGEIEI